MAQMIPAEINPIYKKYSGERIIFESIKEHTPEDWLAIHSLVNAESDTKLSGSEIDFTILIPNEGILIIEVKGGENITYKNGKWDMGKYDPRTEGPFKQVKGNLHEVINHLENKKKGWTKNFILYHQVIFTSIDFETENNEDSLEFKRWEYINLSDLKRYEDPITGRYRIEKLLLNVLNKAKKLNASKKRPKTILSGRPTILECESIKKRLQPNASGEISPKEKSKRKLDYVNSFTDNQYNIVKDQSDRLFIKGAAGSGKTQIALRIAQTALNEDKNILLLCYNQLLGQFLKNIVSTFPKNIKAKIKTYNIDKLLLEIANVTPSNNSEFFKSTLPDLAIKQLSINNEKYLFDELIIDETQDLLTETNINIFDLILKNGLEEGKWKMFGDPENQSVQQYDRSIEIDTFIHDYKAQSYTLMQNYRNSGEIFRHMVDHNKLINENTQLQKVQNLRINDEDTECKFITYKENSDQILQLKTLVKDKLKYYPPEDIIILSPNNNNILSNRINRLNLEEDLNIRLTELNNLNSNNLESIKYSTIRRFKGLESLCIFLIDINKIDHDLLYVGMSRAIDHLYVLVEETIWKEFKFGVKNVEQ
ncbi:MAG: hypothetical protein FI675_00395 [SAR202 cluster bacterium]|nr:hypothetical protein [SAR202 cluster bacterium]|tara:strand:+ start:2888 stop:4669 length:1782 start_codon:yes stop_codon:yes gene_type:complete